MKFFFLLFILFLFSCAHQPKIDEANDENISLDIKEHNLANGLKVLVVENSRLPIFSLYTYYAVGGKFEREGMTGATHFLEHMMFKGAKKYAEGEFDKVVEGSGGSNNAYTTNDLTVYYENLPSSVLSKIIDVEADRMQNLLLEEKSFESEREVVLEERKMRYENSDSGKLFLKMMEEMFVGTPYGTSVIGSVSDIKTVSRENMLSYFKKFYAPNNAVMVVVGDVLAKDVFKEVDKRFSKIEKYKNLEIDKNKILKEKGGFSFKWKGEKEISLKGTSPLPSFMLSFKGVKVGERDAFVLDLLSSILGLGDSSFLSQSFVKNKKPRLSSIYAANYTLIESGTFFISGKLLAGVSLKGLKKEILNSLKVGCESEINERNLEKVKNSYLVSKLSSLDTNAGIAGFIGDNQVYYGDYKFYKKEMSTYDSITISEIKDACSKYLQTSDHLYLTIWNKNTNQG